MLDSLTVEPFSLDKRPQVQHFHFGDEPYQREVEEWIKGPDVEESLGRGTEVYLYRLGDEIVGYGSIGETRRPWPPGQKKIWDTFSIIPMVGLLPQYRSYPAGADRDQRLSSQILLHLIHRARSLAPPVLILYVHPENHPAIKLYERFGFTLGGEKGGYLVMAMKLR
jgi:ribosomal protein S18 acetylase RimI-like enzyme